MRRRVMVVLAGAVAWWALLAVTGGADARAAPAAGRAGTAGVWGRAIEVPGSGALNKGGNASVNSVSCALAGNCAAGGSYTDGSAHSQAFVVSQA